MTIDNTQESFQELWRRLEQTRQQFLQQGRRFCVRRILQSWLPGVATDDFMWEVCRAASTARDHELLGMDLLPPPTLQPRTHRELLRALTQVYMGLKPKQVNRKALDAAYSQVFPYSTPLNMSKKKRPGNL